MTLLYHVFGIARAGLSQKETTQRKRKKLKYEATLPPAFASAPTILPQPISFICSAISVNIWTVARTYRPSQ